MMNFDIIDASQAQETVFYHYFKLIDHIVFRINKASKAGETRISVDCVGEFDGYSRDEKGNFCTVNYDFIESLFESKGYTVYNPGNSFIIIRW